ncbi:nucleotidyltransferase [Anaeromyxobacter dehalogenans]|uniref:Adenylyl/Guanylyl and SMODS C-terminal sensor domain-containing protein n=1 Tax=Anaeromyxobacter dehalogenans (strain 2CP-C) TaxID=290397 RepID=Q2IEI8_ANADE|nr:nucleotidyltransferase [Anaeromyxobacter dehalogenans]ABC82993.1 hypothetical protein Adeh_3225 [Anaeromyxobacter dehalogenans 2CP-C]
MATLSSRNQEFLGTLLSEVTQSLDIPEPLRNQAVERYEAVGAWLATEDSELQPFQPKVFPQGSFRLGTVVRPMNRNGAYDIDLVCELLVAKDEITQRDVWSLVGGRLKLNPEFGALTVPSTRCWTLDWSKSFHMDVLPSIPNVEAQPTGILLGDKKLAQWQKSDPIRYADWFKERMRVALRERRAALAESLGASVEDVPEWRVRTPLQRAVQVLKRHRDQTFSGEEDQKPLSIILTTLAALSYDNEPDLVDALIAIVEKMPQYIQVRDGKFFVMNPAEPSENFADRWNEDPKRRQAFLSWLNTLRTDISEWVHSTELKKAYPLLERGLGKEEITRAARTAEERFGMVSTASTLAAAARSQGEDIPHAQVPPWPLILGSNARLSAAVHRSRGGPKISELADQLLPKHVSILFQLETDVPPPCDVYWQVVNTGSEAAAAKGLRGGIELGAMSKWEDTKYRGTHWVEAFVVKRGACVVRTGRRLVRIS